MFGLGRLEKKRRAVEFVLFRTSRAVIDRPYEDVLDFLNSERTVVLRMTKSGPSQNPNFLHVFYLFEAAFQKKNSPVRKPLPQLPARSALSSAFMVNNAFRKLEFGFSRD
jgi:hypothetical protein